MKPDLKQLQALVAIAQHGTLARAADTLACSPTALSMQLTALQQRLGLTLLRRTGRGLSLTAAGEQLLPAARDAVAAVQRLTTLATAEAGGEAVARVGAAAAPEPVVLGTILDPAALRLGEFLQAVRARGPQIHPELRHGVSGSVLREVRAGRLDLGFCLGRLDPARDRVLRLATVRYVVIAPRGWGPRLQGRSWAELAQLPWITTPRDSVHHALLHGVFGPLQRRLRTVARVDQEASMVDLVRAGFGLSLAREAVALREADQSGLAVSRPHGLETGLNLVSAKPAEAARQAAVQTLLEVATDIWRPGASPP